MSIPILIIGESGSGKSTSLRNLDPTQTFLIKVIDKPLPFREANNHYTLIHKELNPKGNLCISDQYEKIIKLINRVNEGRPEIKTIIIDDFQYCMAFEFMDRATETGYIKFTEIAQHTCNILKCIFKVRKDLNVVFLTHSQTTDSGAVKCKTIGKLLDEKICIEGLFTVVLNSVVNDGSYKFLTQNLGNNIAKTPLGMFEEQYIDNDLSIVLKYVNEYYNLPFDYVPITETNSQQEKPNENTSVQ